MLKMSRSNEFIFLIYHQGHSHVPLCILCHVTLTFLTLLIACLQISNSPLILCLMSLYVSFYCITTIPMIYVLPEIHFLLRHLMFPVLMQTGCSLCSYTVGIWKCLILACGNVTDPVFASLILFKRIILTLAEKRKWTLFRTIAVGIRTIKIVERSGSTLHAPRTSGDGQPMGRARR